MTPHNRPTMGEQEAAAAQRVLASGWLAQGAEVAAFEGEMAQWLGIPAAHAVAVSSGSAALYLALLAGQAAGCPVAAPAYSCRSVWNAIELARATPQWLDCAPGQPNAAPATASAGVRIAAHMFGIPQRLQPREGLFLVEDCAQAIGARVDGQAVGLQGDVGVFSFGATKPFTSGGQGGMLVARSADVAAFLRAARDYDCVPDAVPRFNFQMTDLQAAIGRVQLARFPEFMAQRAELFAIYRAAGLDLLDSDDPAVQPLRFRAVLRCPRPRALQEHLAAHGIRAIVPVETAELLDAPGRLPHAQALCTGTLSLPLYPTLGTEEAARIAALCLTVPAP